MKEEIALTIEFCGSLSDFIKKKGAGASPLKIGCPPRSVKDLIESFGIPHTEVNSILVNGLMVPFSYKIRQGDRIIVEPYSAGKQKKDDRLYLMPELGESETFVVDVHLGVLARWLRLLGFDTNYSNKRGDAELARISCAEKRTLLTRDRYLLMRKELKKAIFIRSEDPWRQLIEVRRRLPISVFVQPFTRCLICNGTLNSVKKGSCGFAQIESSLPEGVAAWCDSFSSCLHCGKVYWRGSHYIKLEKIVRAFSNGYRNG